MNNGAVPLDEVPANLPVHRSPLVQRPRLLGRLRDSAASVVLLEAPSGYGKSVLIEQWDELDPRTFASIILTRQHNDPAMLVGSIIEALDPIEPVPAEVALALANPDPNMEGAVLPRLGKALAAPNSVLKIAAGHTFLILFTEAYPINLISNIRNVSEVAAIYCATSNPVQVIVTKAGGGCSVIGIVDGLSPRAIESEGDKKDRTKLLRDLGYKRS